MELMKKAYFNEMDAVLFTHKRTCYSYFSEFCIQRILIHMHNAFHIQLLAKRYLKNSTHVFYSGDLFQIIELARSSLIFSWEVLLVFLNYFR